MKLKGKQSLNIHLLSVLFQKRENLGELIEAAKLTWNSYVRTRVDGGLKGDLQMILFWNWACPFLDEGAFKLRKGNHTVNGVTNCALFETTQSEAASTVTWLAQLSSTLTLERKPRTCNAITKYPWCSGVKWILAKPPPLSFSALSFPLLCLHCFSNCYGSYRLNMFCSYDAKGKSPCVFYYILDHFHNGK